MPSPVSYELHESIATVTLDDGKRNVLTMDVFDALGRAFDRAEADRATVVLTGRDGCFSAGFDLRVLMGMDRAAYTLVRTGFELGERLLRFPTPVVVACSGHALAMGAFLLLAADYRVGAAGPYRIGANEVAVGIRMPFFGVEMCRQRLSPPYFHRAVINAEIFGPEDAVAAGFLDRIVPADGLQASAREIALGLARLDGRIHAATKLRARDLALGAVRVAIDADVAAFEASTARAVAR
jgi:enoyl-CoA hydratase